MAAGSVSKKEFSVDFKRDPTRSDRIIVPYEESVLKALEEFKAWLIKTVEKAAGPEEVHTQAVQDIVLATLLKQIDARVAAKVLDPIYADAAKYVEQSYLQGDTFASVVMALEPSENIRKREANTIATLLTEQETYLKGMTDDMVKSVKGVITDGMLNGTGMYDTTKSLAEKVDISMSRASAIVRTETVKALNIGALDRYKKEGYAITGHGKVPPHHVNCRCCALSKIIEEDGEYKQVLVWFAAEDERTCEECLALHGTII